MRLTEVFMKYEDMKKCIELFTKEEQKQKERTVLYVLSPFVISFESFLES